MTPFRTWLIMVCVLASSAFAQPPAQAVEPALPRVLLDTTYVPPTGRVISVLAGSDLQTALDAAQPGDIIALEPAASFRGNFILPKKSGSGWITIRSAAPDEHLPSAGARVTPVYAWAMPKLVSPNTSPVVLTAPGAHHYRFIGIEFTTAPNVRRISSIVALGGLQRSTVDTPHHLILDRCYVHGHSKLDGFRGVLLNSAFSAIIGSHISEMHVKGFDSQAILGYNGPGPFKIVNNYLEGAGENIMFGGADPLIPDLVPSDIHIAWNHLVKPLGWNPAHPSYAGTAWTVKNLIELKNAQRVLIEGNVLENMFGDRGAALLVTPRNQENTAPWSLVEDVIFRNNIVKNVSIGWKMQGTDDGFPSRQVRRVSISNNLWLGIARSFFYVIGPIDDLAVDHNTAIPLNHSTHHIERAPPIHRFRLTNNILGFGTHGLRFSEPDNTPNRWLPGAVIENNALVARDYVGEHHGGDGYLQRSGKTWMYRYFASPPAAGLSLDGVVTEGSPLKGAATDGQDIGVNFAELYRALPPGWTRPTRP